jgi:hypothetical protein
VQAAKHKALKMGDAIPLEGDEGDEAKQAERAENESAELDRAKVRLFFTSSCGQRKR